MKRGLYLIIGDNGRWAIREVSSMLDAVHAADVGRSTAKAWELQKSDDAGRLRWKKTRGTPGNGMTFERGDRGTWIAADPDSVQLKPDAESP